MFAVSSAEAVDAFGFNPETIEDVRAFVEHPPETKTFLMLVRDDNADLVQWWIALNDPGDPIFVAWTVSHPRLAADVNDKLAAAAWTTLLGWVRRNAGHGEGSIEVQSFCPAGSEPRQRQLHAAGFDHRRTFWEMIGAVTPEARTCAEVPGLVLTAPADPHTLHAVLNKAFEGHWGFTPQTYGDWSTTQPAFPGHDPELWYLAEVDGVPAAGMILSRRAMDDDALYVQDLATLEAFRHRGIASALLATAFERAAGEGLGRVSLLVDSENSDDAPSVYRKAGLEVRCAYLCHVRDLERQ
jgi:ribosomal protein S18 acetylase RimI-like enzyme